MDEQNYNEITRYGNVIIYKDEMGRHYYSVVKLEHSDSDLHEINEFMIDPGIEEVMFIGGKSNVKIVHRLYGMCETNVKISNKKAMDIIHSVAGYNGKEFDDNGQFIDGSLPDGSRFNATGPQLSSDGPTITIRKFSEKMITPIDLVRSGTISEEACAFLWCCIEGLSVKPQNIIFAGGTGSGKTTMLNAVSMFMPQNHRIITIEDTFELKLVHDHVVRLQANVYTDMDMLLKNSLRMRPDRILVGEVRGKEAQTLFMAMNTGHEGCMGTLHSNSAKELIDRVTHEPMNVPALLLKELNIVVILRRVNEAGGKSRRVVSEIVEMVGSEGGKPLVNKIYQYDFSNKVLKRTGVPSRCRENIASTVGISVKEFDGVLKARAEVIKNAVGLNYEPKMLMEMFEKSGSGLLKAPDN